MNWKNLENCFTRALTHSFAKKKLLWVFAVLVLCGILIVFCRALAFNSAEWIAMSMTFLPMFLASGILLSLGTIVIRVYHYEIKNLKMSYKDLLKASWELIVGTSYLSIPPLLCYLLLWIIHGIFVLLHEIPGIGKFVGIVLAFAPFLLILSSLLLVIFNFSLLFFVSPVVAMKPPMERLSLAQGIFSRLKNNLLASVGLFLIAMLPLLMVAGILALAAVLTGLSYLVTPDPLSIALQWFFIMLPFCAFLSPAVVFFFNFAAESYQLIEEAA